MPSPVLEPHAGLSTPGVPAEVDAVAAAVVPDGVTWGIEKFPGPVAVARPRFYRPELDCLRFLAFLLVFCRHAVPPGTSLGAVAAAAGQSGVCLFFLLSAYLITELLERESRATGQVDLRAFYARRVLRIWPLYFAALLLAWGLDFGSLTPQMSGGRMASLLLLAGNWYVARHGLPASFALVLWSVSVEEQFYLVLPPVRRWLGFRATLLAGVMTLPVSYGSIVWLCRDGATDLQLWVNTLVQVQFFGLGVLLALGLRGRVPSLPGAVRVGLFASGLFALFGSEYFFHGLGTRPLAWNAVREYGAMALGSVLLFFAALGAGRLGRVKGLVYLGKISYGLYVWHVLGLNLAKRPEVWLRGYLPVGLLEVVRVGLGLGLTVAMAHVSYRYFEVYFLRLKERFAVVRTRAVASTPGSMKRLSFAFRAFLLQLHRRPEGNNPAITAITLR